MKFEMTVEQYKQYENEFDSFCVNCGAIGTDQLEGDAVTMCEECNTENLNGMLNLLVADHIEIVEESYV